VCVSHLVEIIEVGVEVKDGRGLGRIRECQEHSAGGIQCNRIRFGNMIQLKVHFILFPTET